VVTYKGPQLEFRGIWVAYFVNGASIMTAEPSQREFLTVTKCSALRAVFQVV
jgi:hypothetical protein